MGKWVQYSGPSHALSYSGLIYLKKRGHEKILRGKLIQTPSTWEWPLLFLSNHNTTLTPLEDTSCGTGRVKLLQSLLLDFLWSRNISKQAKEICQKQETKKQSYTNRNTEAVQLKAPWNSPQTLTIPASKKSRPAIASKRSFTAIWELLYFTPIPPQTWRKNNCHKILDLKQIAKTFSLFPRSTIILLMFFVFL